MATDAVKPDVTSLEPDIDAGTKGESLDTKLGSDSSSTSSASLSSSITGYKYENGRRYHAYREGAYYLSNDEAEQQRLDLVHRIFRLSLDGGLFMAPISKEAKRCLDFGTGTGIWAIDFAEEFPETEVIGTDLSPIQPTWVPGNLRFYVDDVEDGWSYGSDDAFDFIHARGMGGAVKDWNKLVGQIFDNLKPGGWLELQDYEATIFSNDDPDLSRVPMAKKWAERLNYGSAQFGKELDMAPLLKPILVKAGFVDVQEKIQKVPIGPWAKGQKLKEMGVVQRELLTESIEAYTVALFTRVLGWTVDECEELINNTKKEIRDPQHQLYARFWFIWGRKPES